MAIKPLDKVPSFELGQYLGLVIGDGWLSERRDERGVDHYRVSMDTSSSEQAEMFRAFDAYRLGEESDRKKRVELDSIVGRLPAAMRPRVQRILQDGNLRLQEDMISYPREVLDIARKASRDLRDGLYKEALDYVAECACGAGG